MPGNSNTQTREWYTQEEVATMLGVTKQTVYLYEKQGKIKRIPDPYRSYRVVRYEKEEVDALYWQRKQEPRGEKPSELAKKLGISVQTIYRYIQDGLVETVQVPFGQKRTRHIITEKGIQQAHAIVNEHKKSGIQRFEYYDSKLKIAIYQKFASPMIEDARVIRNANHDWAFYVRHTGDVYDYDEGIEKLNLKPCYSIHQEPLQYKGYAYVRIPKDFQYFYPLIDYFYEVWGIENVRLRDEERHVTIHIKEGDKPFSVSFPFQEIIPFIRSGEWWVENGTLYVRSIYRKTSIELPSWMIEKIQEIADVQGKTMSQLIEKVLENYFSNLKS